MTPTELNHFVKRLAAEVGFDRCGIARADVIARRDYVSEWLSAGRAGSMSYLHRHFEQRTDPRVLLPGARSLVMMALLYGQDAPIIPEDDPPRGRVAMYAWGDDYHKIIKRKLFALADRMRSELDEPFEAKACVDTAPLIEREMAAAAGIGWIGKNTLVLDQHLGSYFFLGALVTTLDIAPDEPSQDHCGTCTACLEACPTDAFPAAYEMDATRCISYLTIEHREAIDPSLQTAMGDWVFGCDICQQVCPHNRRAPHTKEPRFAPRRPGPAPLLEDMAAWSLEDYREAVRGSAIKRAKHDMLQRNARIALRNANPVHVDPPPEDASR